MSHVFHRVVPMLVLLAALSGCTREQEYDVQGRVVGFGDDGRTVIVEHQEVRGLMPAMTMPFTARDSAAVARLEQGDAVGFTLVLSGDESWIEAIRTLPPDALPPPTTTMAAPTRTDGVLTPAEPGDPLPAFDLVDQAGQPTRKSDYEGEALLLTFIYTRCPMPDYCPLLSRNFQRLQPDLAARYGGRVRLLSVSLDPAYDTPEVLRAYAARYTEDTENWRFATGSEDEVTRLARALGVYTEPGEGEIIHNLVTVLAGPDGTIRAVWRGSDWTPDDVLAAVEPVMGNGAAL